MPLVVVALALVILPLFTVNDPREEVPVKPTAALFPVVEIPWPDDALTIIVSLVAATALAATPIPAPRTIFPVDVIVRLSLAVVKV